MTHLLLSVFLLAIAAAAQSALQQITAATKADFSKESQETWQIYGVAPDSSVWMMEYNKYFPFAAPMVKIGGKTKSLPAVLSFGKAQHVYILGDDLKTTRLYIKEGKQTDSEDIGGKLVSAPQSLRPGFVSFIVGLGKDGSYWFGNEGDDDNGTIKWEDLGGQFSSDPAILAVTNEDSGGFHGYGISKENGKLLHKSAYTNENEEGWDKDWETLSEGPHKGGITTTVAEVGYKKQIYHLWTLDSKGALLHKTFDGRKYSDWENLGGKFDKTPIAAHIASDRIDVAGRSSETGEYVHKSWNSENKWTKEWFVFGTDFVSEPVGTTLGKAYSYRTYFFGVAKDGTLYVTGVTPEYDNPPPPKDEKGDSNFIALGNVNDPYKKPSSSSWNEL